MQLRQLVNFKIQIKQAQDRAKEDIKDDPNTKYVTDMMVVEQKLVQALFWLDQAIKNYGDGELKK